MSHAQILIHDMSFNLPSGYALFNKLNMVITQQKIGLVGINGIGKSTFIKLITGELHVFSGSIQLEGNIDYIPQNFIIPSELTIGELLGYAGKLKALQRIEQGSNDPHDFSTLNDDWTIKDQIRKILTRFDLNAIDADTKLSRLSGGELTRLLLSKAFSLDADFSFTRRANKSFRRQC